MEESSKISNSLYRAKKAYIARSHRSSSTMKMAEYKKCCKHRLE